MRVFSRLHNGARSVIPISGEALYQIGRVEALARRDGLDGAADKAARRHALKNGVDRRDDERRPLPSADGEPAERRNAPRHDFGIGARSIVGNGIPRRKRNDRDIGREKRDRRLEFVEPSVIACDVEVQTRLIACARRLRDVRENAAVEPFRNAR